MMNGRGRRAKSEEEKERLRDLEPGRDLPAYGRLACPHAVAEALA